MPRKVYKRRPKAGRSRRRRATRHIPRSLPGTAGIGNARTCTWNSRALFTLPLGSANGAGFDVSMSNMYQPFNLILGYDVAPWVAVCGTPARAANGFAGLARILGSTNSYLFQNYRPLSATLTVKVMSASAFDTGYVSITPYKTYNGVVEPSVVSGVFDSMGNPRSVQKNYVQGSASTILRKTIHHNRFFGVSAKEVREDGDYQAKALAIPVNAGVFRVFIANGDAGANHANINVEAIISIKCVLFNTMNDNISTIVV